MKKVVLSTDKLYPTCSVLYRRDMEKLSLAGEIGPPENKVLNVSPIFARYCQDHTALVQPRLESWGLLGSAVSSPTGNSALKCGVSTVEDEDAGIIILDGNHRAKEADGRKVCVPAIIFESAGDCLALADEVYRRATKGVLTKYGVLALFENAVDKMYELASQGCSSVSAVRIEDGSFLDRVKASRSLDFL